MGDLLKAVTDLLATVLGGLGFVGRTRRRENIRRDLELLADLRNSSEGLGANSDPYNQLERHIGAEVARHANVDVTKRDWGGITVGFVFTAPLIYWAYWLVRDGWEWLGLFPSILGALTLIATLTMIISPESEVQNGSQN